MQPGVSALSMLASAYYLLVAAAAFLGAITAMQRRQQKWHVWAWLGVGMFFVALSAMRIVGAEDLLRGELRDLLRAQDSYGERRDFQRPLAAGVIAICAGAGFWWAYRTARSITGRRNIAVALALASSGTMIFLIALRLTSLSPIDAVLYGPLKLNWFADLGLGAIILASAIWYGKIVGRRG